MATQAHTKPQVHIRSTSSLISSRIETQDGKEAATCTDFLFDDERWTIRYVVARTKGFFSLRQVILSPYVFANPEFGYWVNRMPTSLSREQIESSPPLDSDAPVSRRYELELARHYNHPVYWGGSAVWGYSSFPIISAPDPATRISGPEEAQRHQERMEEIGESHLRSCSEVSGYEVFSPGEEIGTVADFMVDTQSWSVRYLVVRTGNWLTGQEVLLSTECIAGFSWEQHQVTVKSCGREKIKGAPKFDPDAGITRDYERDLHNYYGWTGTS